MRCVTPIDVSHLKLRERNDLTDAEILADLPGNNPNWWCKYENGKIYNLKGEQKPDQ